MNEQGFKNLCEINKRDLLTWINTQMSEYYGKENIVSDGTYFFAAGNIPVMICAHLDTVHKHQCKEIVITDGVISSPQGIGGDDRCGVYACLSILKTLEPEHKKPYLFFSTDEEVGGSSTKKAAVDLKNRAIGINFLIELDRANKKDSVYYKCGNKEFKKWIDGFGFKEAQGSNTDICTLMEAWDLAGVNFSVGYYKNHTTEEYVVFSELEDTIQKTCSVIHAMDKEKLFPMMKKAEAGISNYYGTGKSLSNPFVKNDVVITYKLAYGYTGPYYDGTPVQIPLNTQLVVKKVQGMWCNVLYNYESLWVDEYYLEFANYSK